MLPFYKEEENKHRSRETARKGDRGSEIERADATNTRISNRNSCFVNGPEKLTEILDAI